MRQAFMRGVCALNLEAMQVMRRGKPAPTGVAPPSGAAAAAAYSVHSSAAAGEAAAAQAVAEALAAGDENQPPNPRTGVPPIPAGLQ